MPTRALVAIDELAAQLADGATVALPADNCGAPAAAVRALLRRGVRDLALVCVPTGGLLVDILVGAGAVRRLECAAVSLGEIGPAPRFVDAVVNRRLEMVDSTCPALYAALQAGEKGQPFAVLRGLIGSDVLARRGDWKVIDNPFQAGDRIVALPALVPDVALFHAPLADPFGNVYVGRRRELSIMAHAARRTLATVEATCDFDLMADPRLAPGVLPAIYVSVLALAPSGAQPLGLPGCTPDADALAAYGRAAATSEGFAAWLADWVARPGVVRTAGEPLVGGRRSDAVTA